MTATKPIVLSEHALAYADSRRVDPHELLAAIRTEPWHRRGGGRFECRKNFARTGSWADTKQVRVLFVNEPRGSSSSPRTATSSA